MELAGLTSGRLSWRRLGVLVRHLPRDAAVMRAVHGDIVTWSTADHFLASIVELLAGANWQRGGGKGPKPKPLDRPGMSQRVKKRIGGTTLPLHLARRRIADLRNKKPPDD